MVYDDDVMELDNDPSGYFVKKHQTVVTTGWSEVWGAHPSPLLG
jgi:hypothetical protein